MRQPDIDPRGGPLARRFSSAPKWPLVVLVVLLAGLVGYLVWDRYEVSDDDVVIDRGGVIAPPEEITDLPPGFDYFEHERGGYAFVHPVRWKVVTRGSGAQVFPRNRRVIVAMDRAVRGSVRRVVRVTLRSVARQYSKVSIGSDAQLEDINGNQGLVIGGQATNDDGLKIRFFVAGIASDRRNYALTAFTAAGSDPRTVLPQVQEIVSSFQTL